MIIKTNEVRNQAKTLEIQEGAHNQRVDNYLITKLKSVTRSQVYRLIRTGQVRVNSARIKPHYKLQAGDKLRIPPVKESTCTQSKAKPEQVKFLESRILYEDEGLIILNKPAGMAVHGGSGISLGVIEALRVLRPNEENLELAHRLDRDTSGCLLIAKRRKTLLWLHRLLREGGMQKTYHTLVIGQWRGGNKVMLPLHKNQLRSGERIVKVDTLEGKEAYTEFKILKSFEQATLLEAKPITGRTHQIRVHTSYMGHPIVGDEKYGKRSENSPFHKLGNKRLFLHAYAIELPKEDGSKLLVECPLDDELNKLLDNLP